MVRIEPGFTAPQLVRGLSLLDSTLVVIGIVIGSGIFLTTGIIARDLPSPFLILLAWAVGGGLTIAGALTFAELGAAMPRAGGQYVFLREAYGPCPAFLFGWLCFFVYQTGAIAAVASGFAEYLGYFAPSLGNGHILTRWTMPWGAWTLTAGQLSACTAIVALSAINFRGLRAGSSVQNTLTFLKLAAIGAFVLFGFWLGGGHGFSLIADAGGRPAVTLVSGFGVALIAVLWTFDGWHNLTFSAGEIREPQRNLPRALVLGTVAVTVTYLATNAAYLHALPVEAMQGEIRVAEKAAAVLFGPRATTLIAAAVLVSTLGAANGIIMTAARLYYAMAADGLFFRRAARIHPRFHTPHLALGLQCVWACALTLWGSYDRLFTSAMFAGLLIYAATTASVFMLRRTQPELPRPYRVWGYPITPALFLAAVLLIIFNSLLERPSESLAGLGLLALGIPVYFMWRRLGASGATSATGSREPG